MGGVFDRKMSSEFDGSSLFSMICICEELGCFVHASGVRNFDSQKVILNFMTRLNSEERKAREAAFAELLASMNPKSALRREMVAARVRAGLTQAQLARRMGTKQSVIARLETGGRSPSINTLRTLAEATGSRLVVRLDAIEAS